MSFENTPCLNLAVNVILRAKIEFLQKGLALDLIGRDELAQHFYYLSYLYEIL